MRKVRVGGLGMAKAKSWEVTDEFWKQVEPLVPVRERPPCNDYVRKAGGGRKPKDARLVFEGIVYVLRTGCQWRALPKHFGSASAIHTRFYNGRRGSSRMCGRRGLPSTMTSTGLPGDGKVLMVR